MREVADQRKRIGKETLPPIRVRGDDSGTLASELCLSEPFSIGRDETCRIRLDSGQVSRKHAEVAFADGAWWIRDLGSTNGTFVGGERVEKIKVEGDTAVEFGRNGPILHFVSTPANPAEKAVKRRAAAAGASEDPPVTKRMPDAITSPVHTIPGTRADADRPAPGSRQKQEKEVAPSRPAHPPASIEKYVEHYFGPREGPVGDHTMMIRQAYQVVQRKQQRTYLWLILAVGAVCLAVLGYAGYQHVRLQKEEQQAAALFADLRDNEAQIARIRIRLEAEHDQSLDEQLRELERRQEANRRAYDEGSVVEFGIRRPLSDEERVIFKVARIFNESEVTMPADFVRTVEQEIARWQTERRQTFITGIQRAEENGYTPYVVHTFQKYGLPPEFFYLALQESVFDPRVSGPRTNWGIAKGMWQFIPETGAYYGLVIGPRKDERVYDPEDERQNVEKSTDAAARYILDIYGKLSHASGLLAMASYNWGERRVVSKLQVLMEGIPDTPEARSYWRFYREYKDRMPDETRAYVIRIFSAAVIGENPRLFGFPFDNPLAKYMEGPEGTGQMQPQDIK